MEHAWRRIISNVNVTTMHKRQTRRSSAPVVVATVGMALMPIELAADVTFGPHPKSVCHGSVEQMALTTLLASWQRHKIDHGRLTPVVMAVGMALMLELAADVTGAPVVMAVGMAVGAAHWLRTPSSACRCRRRWIGTCPRPQSR